MFVAEGGMLQTVSWELSFPTMVLIDKACPQGLMIEQVEQRRDEVEEKIKELDHVSIDDVDRLIK